MLDYLVSLALKAGNVGNLFYALRGVCCSVECIVVVGIGNKKAALLRAAFVYNDKGLFYHQ